MLYLGLREGYRHTSYGTKEVLPGTIERVSKHFRQVRMRADSGYYSQALVNICEQRGVEFFIVAKQHRNLMNAVREIPESHWKSFADRDLQADDRRRRRRRRANLKRKIAIRRKPNSRFKGAPEIAGMMFKPKSWNKARRYVIDQGLQVRARPGPYTHRLAGGESSLLHDRGTGLELEDVDVESAAPRGWRGDAFPALSVSVDLASRNGREERPQYRRAEAAGG